MTDDPPESARVQQSQPNKVTIKANELKVEAKSEENDIDELATICSKEMEKIMEKQLIGEYQVLEEEDLFSKLFNE